MLHFIYPDPYVIYLLITYTFKHPSKLVITITSRIYRSCYVRLGYGKHLIQIMHFHDSVSCRMHDNVVCNNDIYTS